MARLPRLMGRGRALEVLLSASDIDGDLAERYSYVNRSLPDAELDAFVDALAWLAAKLIRKRMQLSETSCAISIGSRHETWLS
jgi:enoyl-CoA hydratase/carnithine racemase